MPAIQALSSLSTRSIVNATSPTAIQVVCSFPLSSNYGPGARILYYVLVTACVTFRKVEWLRTAALAAALVLPAISALHALVLCAAHVNGAVDMDIYGAFQFCSIGILAANLTVLFSRTYFLDPGRNIIFVWTALVLMGLVALCVEFYRVTPSSCPYDDLGNFISLSASEFPYTHANCSLVCDEVRGPFSILRGGSNSNVYIVPVPKVLTFNACMLLAAGFCIPAILSLFFTLDKVLAFHWKRGTTATSAGGLDEQIEGVNMTNREMKNLNTMVKEFLDVIEIPLFGGVIICIIGIGEANFFSSQLKYQTEPMASIGQWSPIAGVILATLGSLYVLWKEGDKATAKEKPVIQNANSPSSIRSRSREPQPPSPVHISSGDFPRFSADNALGIQSTSDGTRPRLSTTQPDIEPDQERVDAQSDLNQPTAGRHWVRKWLTSATNYLGNAVHDKLEPTTNDEKAHRYPTLPGEKFRNPELERTVSHFERLRQENSRTASTYSPSIISTSGIQSSSTPPPRHESPRPDASPSMRPKRRDTLEVPPHVHGHRRSESFGEGT